MSKHAVIYAATVVLGGGGLWGILHLGADLPAPADLTGTWDVEAAPLGPLADASKSVGQSFVVDQSGQHLRLTFDRGRTLDLKASVIPLGDVTESGKVDMAGSGYRMTGTVRPADDTLVGSFTLAGPDASAFVARRRPAAAKAAPAPSPAPAKEGAPRAS